MILPYLKPFSPQELRKQKYTTVTFTTSPLDMPSHSHFAFMYSYPILLLRNSS